MVARLMQASELDSARVAASVVSLERKGFAWVRGNFDDSAEAFEVAGELIAASRPADGGRALTVIGDFVLPPLGGQATRDFQTLHFDFGLPLDPKLNQDVGLYTALYVPRGFGAVSAATRLVPLALLLGQRAWPSRAELLERFLAYGKTHGAWDDAHGYLEGSLARVVEAAAGLPALPSVKTDPRFLCGMEFNSLRAESSFFQRHSLCVEAVQSELALSSGELLVFDNVALAHGRRGIRRPGELCQRVFGERDAGVMEQRELRERVLSAFVGSSVVNPEPAAPPVSIPYAATR
jgi:hypothetical protein